MRHYDTPNLYFGDASWRIESFCLITITDLLPACSSSDPKRGLLPREAWVKALQELNECQPRRAGTLKKKIPQIYSTRGVVCLNSQSICSA